MENNFLDFRLVNNLLLPSINYVSKNDLKKRDFLSILYGILFLIFACIFLVVVYQQIKSFILQLAVEFANLYFIIDAIFSGKREFLQYVPSTQNADSLKLFSEIIFDELVLLFKMLFPMIISLVTMFLFKKQNFESKVFIAISIILIYTLIFGVYFQAALIIVLFGILIILFITMSYCLFRLFPALGVDFSLLLTLLVVFIIWVYTGSASKEMKLLKKYLFIVYFLDLL